MNQCGHCDCVAITIFSICLWLLAFEVTDIGLWPFNLKAIAHVIVNGEQNWEVAIVVRIRPVRHQLLLEPAAHD